MSLMFYRNQIIESSQDFVLFNIQDLCIDSSMMLSAKYKSMIHSNQMISHHLYLSVSKEI